MTKAAIVILADTESHADLARALNAPETAQEFKENGDDVVVVYDGAGTKWAAELSRPEHLAPEPATPRCKGLPGDNLLGTDGLTP